MTNNSDDVLAIARELHCFFAGKPPEMQGAILAELFATWLAGHRPDIRPETSKVWLSLVRDLIELSDKTHGPDAWDRTED
jgi:hypothetical protein